MKKIYSLIAATAVTFAFTGCIEETLPESATVTQEQVGASASALEASLNGIPSKMVEGYMVYKGEQTHETDMAYPQLMLAQSEMLGDLYPGGDPGYDWYSAYNTIARDFGPNTYYAYLPWFTLYQFIKSANDVIAAVNIEDASVADNLKGMAGQAYAARAFDYYMLMVLFEPVENIYTDISAVKGLTVPIVTEKTSGDDAKNNPRVTHDEMVKFILSDLDTAESLLKNYKPSTKLMPDLAVVYGLKAKTYMWDEDYENAAKYARMAINESGASPVTAAQWEDPTSGFSVANQAWMWYLHYDSENMRNLANWTGWISPESQWSYAQLYLPVIDRSLYDKIGVNDFRKTTFVNPSRYDYYNYKTAMGTDWLYETAPDYCALKFRCVQGDCNSYQTGGASDVPVMRVEEMYLIEAEAVGMSQGVAAGVALLNNFMQQYRDPSYNYTGTDQRQFQLEVLTQERIEFWGEGNAFPNAKRIKPDVIQNYSGTNAPADTYKLNFKGIKPNWTLVISMYEVDANKALKNKNNPNPYQSFEKVPHAIGQFAQPASGN